MIEIDPEFESALRSAGLATLKDVEKSAAERIKVQRRSRDVLRATVIGPDQKPVMLFIKRMWNGRLDDGIFTLLKSGRVRSKARIEYENTNRARAAGIATCRPIAFGERCGFLKEEFSFIITAAAEGVPIDDWLVAGRSAGERSEMLVKLGAWIRRMHDRGIAFPDLYARHIFVVAGAEPQFSLIDLGRLDPSRGPSKFSHRARNLAVLNASVPMSLLEKTDRLRLLNAYEPDRSQRRKLVPAIAKRMGELLQRSRFKDFAKAK